MASEDLLTKKGKRGRFALKSYHMDISGKSNTKAKEVVFKVASNITNANPKSVSQAMDYISRNGERFDEEYISPEDEFGNQLNQEELKKIQEAWGKEFAEEKRKNSRVMTHFVLSIEEKPTEKNLKKFENATRDFLQERFGEEGFRYMFVIHKHNDKAHAHILVNNNNLITKKKLRTNKEWFLETRIMAKEKLIEQGFNYKATLKQDRVRQKDIGKEISKEEKKEQAKGQILVEHGTAPYQFDDDNKESYYVKLSNDAVIWGVGLEQAISEGDAKIGDRVDINSIGKKAVKVTDKDGKDIVATRMEWKVEVTETKEQIEENSIPKKLTEKSNASDWFDAQLKKVARNDEHYQSLLEWKQIIVEAKNKHIEKSQANQARRDIIALDRYSRNASSQENFQKVIRQAGLTKKDIDKAREKVKKRGEHRDRKLDYQIKATAKDLVRAEIGVELSADISPAQKVEMLEAIENTKRHIDPQNKINYYGIKQQLLVEANYSSQLDKYLQEIRKINRTENVTDKNIYRLFRQTPDNKLSGGEKTLFQREREKTLTALEEKGFPATQMFKRWQELEKISQKAKELTQEDNKAVPSIQETQKLLNAMRERLDKVSHSKRDHIRVSKSLDAAQKHLDGRSDSERGVLQANIFKQTASIKTLDKKVENKQDDLAKRQLFAMTKAYLSMKQSFDQLSTPEKASLEKPLAKLETALVERGADLQQVRTQRSISMQIENNHLKMKEVLSMQRPSLEQLNSVIKQTSETKEQFKESSFTVSEKRKINQELNLTKEAAIKIRTDREAEFSNNVKKLDKLYKNAVKLNDTKDNSPTAQFAIKKQLESLQKQFESLRKEINRDIQFVGGIRAQFNFNRDLDTKAKVFGQSRGFER